MHMDAILRITAIVQANVDARLITDKYQLADDVQVEFPEISRETLVDLVDSAIATIGGNAF
jgi:hypothetical protein